MVSGPHKRWIGVENVLARCSGPAIHAAQPTVALHGPNWARVKFVVDEMAAIAMQINTLGELVRNDKHVGTEGTVEDGYHGVRLLVM